MNPRSWPVTIAMALLALAVAATSTLALGAPGAATPGATPPPAQPHAALALDLTGDRVPLELYRRAAQHIELMRGSEMAPGWDEARLGRRVRPFHRPDIAGVAYYEFEVLRPTADGLELEAAGFIMLAAGAHDFPIAHWNYEGPAPSAELLNQAGPSPAGPLKFYKLDTLAYAVEDARGRQLATLGSQPPRIVGLGAAKGEPEPIEETWGPAAPSKDDGAPLPGVHSVSGPAPADLSFAPWESWDALKQGFAEAYAPLIERLERSAAEDWEMERVAARIGEVLRVGESFPLALVGAGQPVVTVTGAGAPLVATELRQPAGRPPVLVVTAVAAQEGAAVPLAVNIAYGGGAAEQVPFVVVDAKLVQPDTYTVHLPSVSVGGGPGAAAAVADAGGAQLRGSWGPWNYDIAGTGLDQRKYDQFGPGTAPNTSSCKSGCGPTAWAMLFGWADLQASRPGSVWAGRWGLYRQSGGRGADAVAPREMDQGVRNMVWEIRSDLGTWCNPFNENAATFPWDMDQATGYLSGRTSVRLSTYYNSFGITEGRLRDQAKNRLRYDRVPVIIGTGWLNHYPLAWKFASRSRLVEKCFLWQCWKERQYSQWFYVNQGWGGRKDGWVPADTWFAGYIKP